MRLDCSKLLTEAKLRTTPAREAILQLFSAGCGPLNAEDVYVKVKNKKINLVTVYRTLGLLEKANILKRVDLHSESVHYELASHHHHHLVCMNCGEV